MCEKISLVGGRCEVQCAACAEKAIKEHKEHRRTQRTQTNNINELLDPVVFISLTEMFNVRCMLGARAPAKIQEVTLMRPIHGNL